METYQIIKKLLADGGKCLLIENGKPVGVVLTMEEYEKFQNKSETGNPKSEMIEPNLIAELADINLTDSGDVNLEDLGLDELQSY